MAEGRRRHILNLRTALLSGVWPSVYTAHLATLTTSLPQPYAPPNEKPTQNAAYMCPHGADDTLVQIWHASQIPKRRVPYLRIHVKINLLNRLEFRNSPYDLVAKLRMAIERQVFQTMTLLEN